MNLTDADRIWFEQQKQTVLDNEDARVVALNNDFDQFRIMLARLAEEMIVDRHQANGMLFDAYFEKPGFREQLLEYLGDAYHEIRDRLVGTPASLQRLLVERVRCLLREYGAEPSTQALALFVSPETRLVPVLSNTT